MIRMYLFCQVPFLILFVTCQFSHVQSWNMSCIEPQHWHKPGGGREAPAPGTKLPGADLAYGQFLSCSHKGLPWIAMVKRAKS